MKALNKKCQLTKELGTMFPQSIIKPIKSKHYIKAPIFPNFFIPKMPRFVLTVYFHEFFQYKLQGFLNKSI